MCNILQRGRAFWEDGWCAVLQGEARLNVANQNVKNYSKEPDLRTM